MIGVTFDYNEAKGQEGDPDYVPWPCYKLRSFYMKALISYGGVSVGLPCLPDAVEEYARKLTGLVITGGGFDIDPVRYGHERHPKTILNPVRHNFEWQLLDAFIRTGKPILGVCAGMQLLNVYFGGTLIQHLPDNPSLCGHKGHEQEHMHTLKIVPGTKLAGILGVEQLKVNSLHHQGIGDLAADLVATAFSEDGMTEGLEHPKHPFCLGVQWHPEYLLSIEEHNLWKAFVQACTT